MNTAFKIAIDFLCLLSVGLSVVFIKRFATPYHRGFFCDDISLRYPYKDSTIRNYVLYGVGIGVPVLLFIPAELLVARNRITSVSLIGQGIPLWVLNSYKSVGAYFFGGLSTMLLTDIGKYSIGRLRPHFMDTCRPTINCSDPRYHNEYITDYSCDGGTEHSRKEMRLSFPSGHSSFTAYVMVYASLFIQGKMNWRGSFLLKRLLQLCFISMAWGTGLSRVSDNKHHWSDVLTGFIIGIAAAFLTAVFIARLLGKTDILNHRSLNLMDSRRSTQIL